MGPFSPLAIALAPEIARFAFGARGAEAEAAVADVVRGVTGAADATAAQTVVARDPQVATQLRAQLAQLAAREDQATRRAELDEAAARLRGRRTEPGRWVAGLVSVLVMAIFGFVIWATLAHALPAGSETTVNMLLGTLAAMATSVVGYWVGSSAGSDRKTDLLFRSRPADPSTPTGGHP